MKKAVKPMKSAMKVMKKKKKKKKQPAVDDSSDESAARNRREQESAAESTEDVKLDRGIKKLLRGMDAQDVHFYIYIYI